MDKIEPEHFLAAEKVGQKFIGQYYTLLNKAPQYLHRFYRGNSLFKFDDCSLVCGQEAIKKVIQQQNFRNCSVTITASNFQSTVDNGVVVNLIGKLINDGKQPRNYTETFILVALSPRRYYIRNHIFRYRREIALQEERPIGDVGLPMCRVQKEALCDAQPMSNSFVHPKPHGSCIAGFEGFGTIKEESVSDNHDQIGELSCSGSALDNTKAQFIMPGTSSAMFNNRTPTRMSDSKLTFVPPASGAQQRSGSERISNYGSYFRDSRQLFLGNIPHRASENELKMIFERFGSVVDLQILFKQDAKSSQRYLNPLNYGFLTYEHEKSVQECLDERPIFFAKDSPDAQRLLVEEKKPRKRNHYEMQRNRNDAQTMGGSNMPGGGRGRQQRKNADGYKVLQNNSAGGSFNRSFNSGGQQSRRSDNSGACP